MYTLESYIATKMAIDYVNKAEKDYNEKTFDNMDIYISVLKCLHLPTGLDLQTWWEKEKNK